MKIKKLISLIVLFIIITFINSTCFASSGSFSLSKSSIELEEGKTSSFTINLKNCEGKFTISSSNNSVASVDKSIVDGFAGGNTTITVTGKKAGTATITVIADDVADTDAEEVNGSRTITVTVKDKTEPTPTVSSDATLANFGINPYDFTGFKPGISSYDVTVPKEVSTINIYATKRTGQTVTGTGNKNLDIGKNTFNVVVTAEDKKTTKTYTLNVTRESISKVATLKNLGIRPNDFRNFKSNTYSYTVNVPYDVEKINIYAEKTSASSTVTGTGDKTLELGKNTFNVVVTAENKKTTKTYTLIINRKEKDEAKATEEETDEKEEDKKTDSNAEGLTSLKIAGLTLNPEFSNDVYEYTLEATDEIEKLDIETKTSSNKIDVEIIGNEKFEIGENLITILVKNEDGTKTTYQITVNAKPTPVDVTELNKELKDAQNKIKIQKMIVIGTIGIVLILIVIFLFERYKIQRRDDDDYYSDEDDDSEDEEEEDDDDDDSDDEKNFYNDDQNINSERMQNDEHMSRKDEVEEVDEKFEKIRERFDNQENEDYEYFDEIKQKRWNAKGKRYK